MENRRLKHLAELEKKISYTFSDKELLNQALTHSSYRAMVANDCPYNEELEFLGDSVLDLVIGEYLFLKYKDWDEGKLSKYRARVVCGQSLIIVGDMFSLGDFILVGKGEQTGKGIQATILEDAVEALIAAIYIDGGFTEAKKFIMRFFTEHIEKISSENLFRDFKTELQEIVHQYRGYKIEYRLLGYSGPDHDRTFTVEVLINNEVAGTGEGKSKKDAEKNAAFAAIENFEHGNIKILKRR
ncbi:MAG: ribonuclease III [Clostridiales bacterium]|nr:ribonuclease III [Clostridiales bacterium]